MPPRRYYFRSTDDTVLGPVSLNVVAEMIRAQKLKANTPVSLDGRSFKPMKAFPELATLLSVDIGPEGPEPSDESAVLDVPPTYSGDITEVSIPKLLFHFSASKATGRLNLCTQGIIKDLYLVNGKIVAAASNLDRDQLGQHLIRHQVISEEQMNLILLEIQEEDTRLGDYLIHKNILSPHALFEHLREQFFDKMYEVFNWRVGQYSFYEGQEYKGSLLPINASPWETIAEGVRRGYEAGELKELLLPFVNYRVCNSPDSHVHLNQLGLSSRELKVFKLASSQRTLGSIIEDLGGQSEDLKIALAMVYLGIELELLTFGEVVPEAAPEGEIPGAEQQWDQQMDATVQQDAPTEETRPVAGPVKAHPPVTRQEQVLLETLNEIREQDYFERLGLEITAKGAEVGKAFLKAAKTYHPDNVAPDAPERLRELSSQIFTALNEAQQILGNDATRQEYLQNLESGRDDGKVDVGGIVQAEMLFQKGEVMLNGRKFAAARDLFDQALKLNPDEGEFYIFRGYAAFFAKPDADSFFREQCSQLILKGLKMRDNSVANGYLFLGRIQKAAGDEDNARKSFKKVLALEHNHVEAQRELRLMSMRDGKKGGLGGLFRKK